VRYQGGSNAGHTLEVNGVRYVLHLVPSGVLYPGKLCVIGNGLVVDPFALVKEIRELQAMGIQPEGRLFVSDRAHLVLPYHMALDAAGEGGATGSAKIGTTQRGIGPAYADKMARTNLRMADLLDPDLDGLVRGRAEAKNHLLAALGAKPVDVEALVARLREAAAFLRGYIADTVPLLNDAVRQKRAILFEGAQGTMLDIDFGTYPFVTSSNPTSGGVCTGTGVPVKAVDHVVGVLKAYTTRVGEGPFPTELPDATGEHLRQKGREFGATTGRPRRCGWFDAVVARYAVAVNGIDSWALTKLDVLDGMDVLKVCVAYECDGRRLTSVPAGAAMLARCRPVYEDVAGWRGSTTSATRFEELPREAQAYIRRLEALTGVRVGLFSVGPGRENTFRAAAG
jgi:adenylosuccinate synthase